MNEATCYKCKAVKPLEEFYHNRNTTSGYDTYCKPCRRAANDKYKEKNPDYQRDYYFRVTKPRRKAAAEAIRRLKELDPTWNPGL